jgi:potassium efflux system protein
VVAQPARAQAPTLGTSSAVRGEIAAAIANLRANPAIAETSAVATLDEAGRQLGLAEQADARAKEFLRQLRESPRETEAIRAELAATPEAPVRVDATASLAVAEAGLAKAASELSAARARVAQLDDEKVAYGTRRIEIPALLADATQALERVRVQAIAEPDTSPQAEARRILARAREHAIEADILALERELESFDVRRDRIIAGMDQAARRISQLERLVAGWEQVLAQRRSEMAEAAAREAQEARQAVEKVQPALREIAEENATLAEMRAGTGSVAKRIEQVARDTQRARRRIEEIGDQFAIVRRRVNLVGYNEAIGPLMRKHRAELPDLALYHRRIRTHQDEIGRVQLVLFDLSDKRTAVADPDSRITRALTASGIAMDENQRSKARQEGRALLRVQQEYLSDLLRDYDRYFGSLANLDAVERELLAAAQEYNRFILEHVLWIRSTDPLSPTAVLPASRALIWLGDPRNWLHVVTRIGQSLGEHVVASAFYISIIGALFYYQPRLRRRLHQSRSQRAHSATAFLRTVTSLLGTTLLISLPWASVLGFSGWLLDPGSGDHDEFTRALSSGLLAVAPVYLGAEFVRQLLHQNGLFARDLNLGSARTRPMRLTISWTMLWGLPPLCLAMTLAQAPTPAWSDSLGRIAFCGAIGVLGASLVQLLRSKGGPASIPLLAEIAELRPRTGRLLRLAFLLATAGIILAALAGYYLTAMSLAARLFATLIAVVNFVLLYAVLARALQISQLALERAQSRVLATAAATETSTSLEEAETAPDLPALSAQARQLLRTITVAALVFALWLIWSEMVPALYVFDSVVLWEVTGTGTETIDITLRDVLVGCLIVGAATVAARNLPGFLHMVLLQRLQLDAGSRYAITSVVQYVLALVAILTAFNTVGMRWAHIQWLAAAMTVGLGFGLQEIVANFVSGLILLFERPIRVGDTVTLGQISGVVSQIRIRATTITDWDRKELIVPNKEFITGQLINWTRSDDILRVVVQVGIAYGSDVDLAEKLLLEIASECRTVRNDPPATVLFDSFGDNALGFTLRVFVSHISDMWVTKHALHRAIDRRFREAGIAIAFPQRDLHITSVEGAIPVRILKGDNG